MTIDHRFALLADNGDVLFPYVKQDNTGRRGFALSAPGKRDAKQQAIYTKELEEVVRRVVVDGWKVRAKTLTTPPEKPRTGSYVLGGVIKAYWVSPELSHLVAEASHKPQSGDKPIPIPVRMAWPYPGTDDDDDELNDIDFEDTAVGNLAFKAAEVFVDADPDCQDVSSTTRQALINARIGQGGYRKRMMALWGDRCAVSGCGIPAVLIASHAVAWADCQNNEERLDEYNGLLLAASIDRLFDGGQISFDDRGRLLVAAQLTDEDLQAIGMSRSTRLRFVPPSPVLGYLKRHRVQHGFQA